AQPRYGASRPLSRCLHRARTCRTGGRPGAVPRYPENHPDQCASDSGSHGACTAMTIQTAHRPAEAAGLTVPFDHRLIDNLLEEAGIDVLVATSKHNVQYLLGGYRFFFFDYKEAIGMSRYLPVLIYPRGRPADAVYIGNRLEAFEKELNRFWTPTVETKCW